MDAILYNFSKRTNSTMRPSSGTVVSISLKEMTSIRNPLIQIFVSMENVASFTNFNYCLFMGRYYYIIDTAIEANNVINYQLTLDYLATYKNDILSTTAYVKLSSVNYDVNIIDERMTPTANKNYHIIRDKLSEFNSSGMYVVSVAGKNKSGTSESSLTSLTVFANNTIYTFSEALYDDTVMAGLKAYFVGGLSDSILSIIYYPINILPFIQNIGVKSQSQLNIGNQTLTVTNYLINGCGIGSSSLTANYVDVIFSIEDYLHNDFRDTSPYLKLFMYIPFCGLVNIDASTIYGYSYIIVRHYVEVTTGTITAILYASKSPAYSSETSFIVGTASGSCGVQVPFGQTQLQTMNLINSAVSGAMAVGSVATGNAVGGIMGTLNAINQLKGIEISQSGGSVGSIATLGIENNSHVLVLCEIELEEPPSSYLSKYGRPCGKILQLSTLSGFTQTEGASISSTAPDDIVSQINNELNGGVYIE